MPRKNQNDKKNIGGDNLVVNGSARSQCDSSSSQTNGSWLAYVSGLDPIARLQKKRLLASELFATTCLIPLVQNGAHIDESVLVDLLVEFKEMQPEIGVDFEMAHVMGTLLNRFQYHFFEQQEGKSVTLGVEARAYICLAELDFKGVEDAVRKRQVPG